jgi:hypothetical protein
MFHCSFILNNEDLSDFVIGQGAASRNKKLGGIRFPAYSGMGEHRNSRAAACVPDAGPIPPGRYFIFERETGGRLGWARAMLRTDKSCWFSLYREDAVIDDRMLCDQIERGNFRIHPNGAMGVSKGCIAIQKEADFRHLASILLSVPPQPVAGSKLLAYGTLTVS